MSESHLPVRPLRHAAPRWLWSLLIIGATDLSGCHEHSHEATRVEVPVRVDGRGIVPVTTDLGYTVQLTEARAALADLTFARGGQAHAALRSPSVLERLALAGRRWWVGTAHAHPGHEHGGEITGGLAGRFIVDWVGGDGAELGRATLLTGDYESVNFIFSRGEARDGLADDDPLLERTAVLAGEAQREGQTLAFVVHLVSPMDRALTDGLFKLRINDGSNPALGLKLHLRAANGATLFDGVDFFALGTAGETLLLEAADSTSSPDATGAARSSATDRIRRAFQTHDLFGVAALPEPG